MSSMVSLASDGVKPARALLMANAYTAIADGAHSLHYNPALLGRHSGFTFTAFNFGLTFPNVLSKLDQAQNLGSSPSDFADIAMGFPINIGYNFAPGFKMGRFGFSAIVDNQTNLLLLNKITPMMQIKYKNDRGMVIGYAHPINKMLSLGFSAKYINRESLNSTKPLTGTSLLNAIDSGQITSIMDSLGKVDSDGWSTDIGIDYINKQGPTTFSMGIVAKDIYNTISTDKEEDEDKAFAQTPSVNVATSWALEFGAGFGFITAAEFKDIHIQDKSLLKKLHLGAELNLTPALGFMSGYNDKALSYGVKLDLALMDFYIGFFEEHSKSGNDLAKASGIVLYFSFADFNFDV
ncbi:MAG: hypothetical protein N4A33_03705 [Bacteriovoracaceae bacterium]|jgi:hypothetical protein|nr:hypothetical protein [Bacteriovoracaceae bacterium]